MDIPYGFSPDRNRMGLMKRIQQNPTTGWYDCPVCEDSYDTEREAQECLVWCEDFAQECEDLMTGDPDTIEEI